LAVEAALVADVAGGAADLFDRQEDRVEVAVEIDRPDELDIAALFALAPQFFAAAAVIDGSPRGEGLGVAFM